MSASQFLKSVEYTYDRAGKFITMPPGLDEKIKVSNSSYIV